LTHARQPAKFGSMTKQIDEEAIVHVGSGNFLADMGYPDPEETRTKFFLGHRIAMVAEARGLDRAGVAAITGLTEEEVVATTRSRVEDVSVWRMMRAVTALGCNIHIVIGEDLGEPGAVIARCVEDEDEGNSDSSVD
jgi:hypothetical protein